MRLHYLVSSSLCILLVSATTNAGTIATWTFETSLPSGTDQTVNPPSGGYAPEIGAGSAVGVHASADTDWSNPSGNGSSESWNSNNWGENDYYQFQASTLGETGITFSWDQTRSSSGPGGNDDTVESFRVQYSTDGSSYTDAFNYAVPITSSSGAVWTSNSLSGNSALDNQANVYFRITSNLAGTSTNGQSRVDNVSITSIPEPVTARLALAALAILATRRRGARQA